MACFLLQCGARVCEERTPRFDRRCPACAVLGRAHDWLVDARVSVPRHVHEDQLAPIPMGIPMDIPMDISMDIPMGIPMDISMDLSMDISMGISMGKSMDISMDILINISMDIPMGISMLKGISPKRSSSPSYGRVRWAC